MTIIEQIRPLVEAGFSLHWLRSRSKAPVDKGWSTVAFKTMSDLTASWSDGLNVGVRLGEYSKVGGLYLHAIDLDVRVDDLVDDALDRLAAIIPDYQSLPFVLSGSGGESRHFYFLCERPFHSRKLARSPGFSMVMDPTKGRPVKKHDWEIELFGTGKQVAMPPSVHPDTGAEYAWGRPFDLDLIDLGLAPTVSAYIIETIAGVPVDPAAGDTDERPPLGLSIAEARGHVMALPTDEWCIDRDGWFRTGMALHHEFADRGLAGEAFELWCEFSGQSDKFDINDAQRVWKSFKDTKRQNIRMASVVQAAKYARFEAAFGEIDGDGFDDVEGCRADEGNHPETGGNSDVEGGRADEGNHPADDLDDLVEKRPASNNADWWKYFDLNQEGAIRPTLPNVRLIVANDVRMKGVMGYNQFSEGIVRTGTPDKLVKKREPELGTKQLTGDIWDRRDTVNGDLWRDAHDHAVRDLIETPKIMGGYGIKVSDRDLGAALSLAANENLFHPVRQFLDNLEWDGQPRIESLFVRYFGAPDTAYTRGVARNMLVGGVARIYEPGHKFDYAVILEGMQGKRKTTFIETLAMNWFGELASEFDNTNKMIESMQNAWIIEIPELSGFSKHDVQAIKAFISRRVDRARLAWAKRAQDYHRQCIFIGSTNDAKYLRDDTGGRRFWPIECLLDESESIDIEALKDEVVQIWAEARAVYLQMRVDQPHGWLPLYLSDPEASAEAERLQESRRVETIEDVMAGQVAAWLEMPIARGDGFGSDEKVLRNATCSKQVWVEALGNDGRSFNAQAAQTVGRAMRKVKGWDSRGGRTRSFGNYGKQRGYFRKSEVPKLEAGGEMIF